MHALPRLWRETDFRWLFLSQTISTTGDRIVLVALALLVTEQTGSTTDLGIVVGAQTAALVTFLLIGGVWADRLPRHRIMVSTDLIRCALHTLLAILIFADALDDLAARRRSRSASAPPRRSSAPPTAGSCRRPSRKS